MPEFDMSTDPKRATAADPDVVRPVTSRAEPVSPRGGRPSHVPTDQTRRLVERLSALDIPPGEIAGIIGVSRETLRKHYRQELETGLARMIAHVGANLLKATGRTGAHATRASMFLLQARGGWRTTGVDPLLSFEAATKSEPTAYDGTDIHALSDEELEAYDALLAQC